MSDPVDLGGAILLPAEAATVELIYEHLRRRSSLNSDLVDMLAREKDCEMIGAWSFASLSLPSLRVVSDVVGQMASDSVRAAPRWRSDRRDVLERDLARFVSKLGERITQLEAANLGI